MSVLRFVLLSVGITIGLASCASLGQSTLQICGRACGSGNLDEYQDDTVTCHCHSTKGLDDDILDGK